MYGNSAEHIKEGWQKAQFPVNAKKEMRENPGIPVGPDMVMKLHPVSGKNTRGSLRIWDIGNFRGRVNDIQETE